MSVKIYARLISAPYVHRFKKIKGWRSSGTLSYIHHIGKDPLRALTLGNFLEITASKYYDTPAVISMHQNKSLTFGNVLEEADKFAAGLKATGLKRGDRVAIWLPNQYEWHVLMMACARAGFIMVALNPAYQAPEIDYCIKKVGIKAIICGDRFKTQNYYEILNRVVSDIGKYSPGKIKSKETPSLETVVMITDQYFSGTYNYNEILHLADATDIKTIKTSQHLISPDDGCNIQFTSGTTGKPKAAMVSHFNIVNNSYEIAKRTELFKKYHKICVQVPLFHAFGTTITLFTAFHFGSTLVLPTYGYNPDDTLTAIKKEKCTVIHGTPTMYVDLVNVQNKRKEDISPEIAVSGGAPCSPHLFRQMLSVLNLKKVKSVFGLTETTSVCFHSLPDDDEEKSTSTVGHLGEHLEAKVIDAEGRMVPFGQPGELCVRGYINMLGYWDDDEKTKETIGPDRWLKTGDQFILESNGYGRVVGRLKEMIIRGGENIFPKEIEDFLNTHPDILETHVIGVAHERLGEEVCACVRLREGASMTQKQLVEFCKGKIAHFKIPSQLSIVDEFPKTASGKIQKFVLKQTHEKTK